MTSAEPPIAEVLRDDLLWRRISQPVPRARHFKLRSGETYLSVDLRKLSSEEESLSVERGAREGDCLVELLASVAFDKDLSVEHKPIPQVNPAHAAMWGLEKMDIDTQERVRGDLADASRKICGPLRHQPVDEQ